MTKSIHIWKAEASPSVLEADWSSGPRVACMLRQAPTQHDMTTARSISGACEPSCVLLSTAVAPQSCCSSSASNLAGPAACGQCHSRVLLLIPIDTSGARYAAFLCMQKCLPWYDRQLDVRKQEDCCLSLQGDTVGRRFSICH